MKSSRRLRRWWSVGLGLVLAAGSGCQTYYAGMNLPSPWYLQHPPQYFPEDPVFPLANELREQERINALGVAGANAVAVPLPRPVPGVTVVPGPGPAPLPPPIPAGAPGNIPAPAPAPGAGAVPPPPPGQ